jgi:hypothetical protein
MTDSDEDHDRSRRPGAEDQRWSHRSGTQWLDDRVTLYVVWTVHVKGAWVSWLSLKTKVDGLSVVWPQNHWDDFLRFGLKTDGDGFFRFGLKTGGSDFLVWASKLTAIFC